MVGSLSNWNRFWESAVLVVAIMMLREAGTLAGPAGITIQTWQLMTQQVAFKHHKSVVNNLKSNNLIAAPLSKNQKIDLF